MAALFIRSQRRTDQPVLPMAHLHDKNVQAGLLGGAFGGALLYSTATYIPLWMTEDGRSALVAGVALVPMLAAWAVGSSIGVKLLIRGGMRASVGFGYLVAAVGAVMLALCAHFHASLTSSMASLAVLGIGLGPALSTSIVGPQSVVPWKVRSTVTSGVYVVRMIGGALTIALLDLIGRHAGEQVALIAPVAVVGAVLTLMVSPGPRRNTQVAVDALSAID
jgi:MFS family permease